MKITLILMILFVFKVNANSFAQKININVKNISIKEVFGILTREHNCEFIYDSEILENTKNITLSANNISINEFLDKCFYNQNLDYKVKNNTFIIFLKESKTTVIKEKVEIQNFITGVVIDDEGLPMPNASVKIKGTNTTVTANQFGQFKINANVGQILVFSFIGFQTQEYKIKDYASVNIKLLPAVNSLNEVVVTGYGSEKRSDIISAVGIVNIKDLQKAPVASFEEALAGRVAGVQVTSSEGGPFATNNIVIRGNNSISQDNSPLWVIDGFPLENPNNNTLNSNDIESITVLKDAASTSIYGSRAANGVIVVTTKKGSLGKTVINFNGTYGYQEMLKRMDLLNPYEYVKYQTELVGVTAKQTYTPGDPSLGVNMVADGRTLDYYIGAPFVNWQDQLYRKALFENYSLSLSGGVDKTRYLFSGSYTNQDGTIIASNFKRYQGRFNFSQEVNKKTNLNLNVNYANTLTEGSTPSSYPTGSAFTNSMLSAIWGYRPAITSNSSVEQQLETLIDPDGNSGGFNPLTNTKNSQINNSNNNLSANSYFDYTVLKNLVLRVSGGLNYVKVADDKFYGSNTTYGGPGSLYGPNGSTANNSVISLLNENTLTYKKVFKKYHSLNLLGGFSVQKTKYKNSSIYGTVPNEDLGISGLDEGTPLSIGSSSSSNFLNSYFTRANYNYKSKYLLSASIRADGSSKFSSDNKWGYFPALAVSYNVANEEFIKKNKYLSILSQFKLRASYGEVGNNRVGDFAYLSQVNLNNIATSYAFQSVYTRGAVQNVLGNSKLKWETTESTDFGIDIGILKNKIELTIDYYKKVTRDLLLQATLPGHMGYTSAIKNIGSVKNTGWEFTLNTVNFDKKKFKWNTDFNVSFNKNKVLSLSSGQNALLTPIYYSVAPEFPYIAHINGPIAQFIGYKWLGNYQYSDFDLTPTGSYVLKGNVSGSNIARSTIKPGDIKYEDINGDGVITDADKVVIGNPNPVFTGGFTNNFTYHQFDLNVLLSFSYGNDVLNANRLVFEGGQFAFLNQFASMIERWTPENQTNEIPRAGGQSGGGISSRVIEDGSFLRLKTISFGYNLSSNFAKKIQVKNARFYVSAQNIAVWSKYKGSDPEVSTRPGALTQGFDYASSPRSFTTTLGINFSF